MIIFPLKRLLLGGTVLLAACGNGQPDAAPGGITAAASSPASSAAAAPMLPRRDLACTLGRATNVDTSREQTMAEMVLEGSHRFALTLPSIPVRQTPPPDPTDPAEPVHPETRVTADPDALRAEVPGDFDRVVDLWPDRVEMARTINPNLYSLIIISDYSPQTGTVQLMMTRTNDVASYEFDRIYLGTCTVTQ